MLKRICTEHFIPLSVVDKSSCITRMIQKLFSIFLGILLWSEISVGTSRPAPHDLAAGSPPGRLRTAGQYKSKKKFVKFIIVL